MRIVVTITGPDAIRALAELRSNIQYDKLNVKLVVDIEDK